MFQRIIILKKVLIYENNMMNKEKGEKEENKDQSGITFTIHGKDGINVEKEKSLEENDEDTWIEFIDEDEKNEISIEDSFKQDGKIKVEKDTRIELINVSKKFNINYQKNQTALARLLSFFTGENKRNFWALDNISFKVKAGENLGIIGKNGSGKSTLLRAIAEVYQVDEGHIWTNGRLVYLTGFGHGLQPKLTMKENIFLVGSIMGLGQPDIKERFDEIVEFAGLRDYVNTKLFKFSTGMQTRLASSIGLHCVAHRKPDILLVDEVIGGGADKDYQEKSLKKMEELLKGGSTVVLVSHNLDAIKNYCNRVIWLEDGKVKMEGKPEEVIEAYKKSS